MRPGISFSAMTISLRPQAASELYSCSIQISSPVSQRACRRKSEFAPAGLQRGVRASSHIGTVTGEMRVSRDSKSVTQVEYVHLVDHVDRLFEGRVGREEGEELSERRGRGPTPEKLRQVPDRRDPKQRGRVGAKGRDQ